MRTCSCAGGEGDLAILCMEAAGNKHITEVEIHLHVCIQEWSHGSTLTMHGDALFAVGSHAKLSAWNADWICHFPACSEIFRVTTGSKIQLCGMGYQGDLP